MKKIITTLLTMVALSGCYKAEFYDTDHPDQGQVVISVPVPDDVTESMTIIFEGEEYAVEPGEDFTLPVLFDPGEYTYYIYTNTTDGEETYFSYDSSTGSIIATIPVDDEGNVDPNFDDIYFGTETITILADASVVASTDLSQLGRELHFKLELSGDAILRLDSFSASLNGVAQQWDCINDIPHGTSVSVRPDLAMSSGTLSASLTRSSDSYYLEGTVHLLGLFTDETQTLTLELGYTDSNPASHIFTSDVTDLLSSFNDDNSTSMTITNSVETPTEANPSGTIGDWVVTEYSITVK